MGEVKLEVKFQPEISWEGSKRPIRDVLTFKVSLE